MAKVGSYDWIIDFSTIRPIIEEEIGPLRCFEKALVSGCGTSIVPVSLLEAGVSEVFAVDIEEGCIDLMASTNPALRCLSNTNFDNSIKSSIFVIELLF